MIGNGERYEPRVSTYDVLNSSHLGAGVRRGTGRGARLAGCAKGGRSSSPSPASSSREDGGRVMAEGDRPMTDAEWREVLGRLIGMMFTSLLDAQQRQAALITVLWSAVFLTVQTLRLGSRERNRRRCPSCAPRP